MIVKIVFFCLVSLVFGQTPEDLKTYFQDIDSQIKSFQQASDIIIRSRQTALENDIHNAKTTLDNDLNEAAEPYWATIRALEYAAEKSGQDISLCIQLGNDQLYQLNNTINSSLYTAYDYYFSLGMELINYSLLETQGVLSELTVLNELVTRCSDENCATSLQKDIEKFYDRANVVLDDAQTKVNNYVLTYLPEILTWFVFDTSSYLQQCTIIITDVENCVNNITFADD